ncbi:uncharacterized protein C8Q71DRAFT_204911 [Rhodofomes roseus]|uniref:Secreted protein n=1 Tax=Rhodofomes roseus TaxID=34475 RepID=A0ABQ8KTS3_9APHY|nr:uncharacterized protein C8Q71DRAFT_204911 [Rhodofomes roseus]KAH9842480.1 hypothetical protein C8Q71DRAFT_204911 [Rhodofomes roseus]
MVASVARVVPRVVLAARRGGRGCSSATMHWCVAISNASAILVLTTRHRCLVLGQKRALWPRVLYALNVGCVRMLCSLLEHVHCTSLQFRGGQLIDYLQHGARPRQPLRVCYCQPTSRPCMSPSPTRLERHGFGGSCTTAPGKR